MGAGAREELFCCFSFHPESWQKKKIKWNKKNYDHKSVN